MSEDMLATRRRRCAGLSNQTSVEQSCVEWRRAVNAAIPDDWRLSPPHLGRAIGEGTDNAVTHQKMACSHWMRIRHLVRLPWCGPELRGHVARVEGTVAGGYGRQADTPNCS